MSEEESISTQESWENARNYFNLLGAVPSSFSSAIRTLLLDEEKHGGVIQFNTKAALLRLFSSPGTLSPLYFAASTLYPDRVDSAPTLTTKELIAMFRAETLAGVLGALFLTRRCKKQAPETEWSEVYKDEEPRIELQLLIGESIAKIGGGKAVLYAVLRSVVRGAFQIHDLKGSNLYRRHIESTGGYDPGWEFSRWGCTLGQVGSVAVQLLGFGTQFAGAVAKALDLPYGEISEVGEEDVYRLKLLERWCKDLLATGKEPDIVHRGDLYPINERSKGLFASAAAIKSSGVQNGWLMRGKDDISPDLTPKLFTEAQKADHLKASEMDPATDAPDPADIE